MTDDRRRGAGEAALIDSLQESFAELILTGSPLAEQIETAVESGDLGKLRAAAAAVAAWRDANAHAAP